MYAYPNQELIARRTGVSRATVTRVLNGDPAFRASPTTRARVLAAARAVGYDRGRLRRIHRRATPRLPFHLPVRVTVWLQASDRPWASGQARLTDLSVGGARLDGLRLGQRGLPTAPFWLELEVADEQGRRDRPLHGLCLRGRPVRFEMNGGFGLGIVFVDLPRTTAIRLQQFLDGVGNGR